MVVNAMLKSGQTHTFPFLSLRHTLVSPYKTYAFALTDSINMKDIFYPLEITADFSLI